MGWKQVLAPPFYNDIEANVDSIAMYKIKWAMRLMQTLTNFVLTIYSMTSS